MLFHSIFATRLLFNFSVWFKNMALKFDEDEIVQQDSIVKIYLFRDALYIA